MESQCHFVWMFFDRPSLPIGKFRMSCQIAPISVIFFFFVAFLRNLVGVISYVIHVSFSQIWYICWKNRFGREIYGGKDQHCWLSCARCGGWTFYIANLRTVNFAGVNWTHIYLPPPSIPIWYIYPYFHQFLSITPLLINQ